MSTLRVNAIQDTAGVERYMARAWVNFNGTGTVAIRAAGNVSSITDNGTGDYTVNFATAMPNTNYAALFGVTSNGTNDVARQLAMFGTAGDGATGKTTSSLRILHGASAAVGLNDSAECSVAIFR